MSEELRQHVTASWSPSKLSSSSSSSLLVSLARRALTYWS